MIIEKPLAIKQPEVGIIRELRLLTGLTQEQFAELVLLTPPLTVERMNPLVQGARK